MDLSKAFDCMHHCLLLTKLKAYDMSCKAVELNGQLPAGQETEGQSFWLIQWLAKCQQEGVPGLNPGAHMFNIFINDTYMFFNESELYNYADYW